MWFNCAWIKFIHLQYLLMNLHLCASFSIFRINILLLHAYMWNYISPYEWFQSHSIKNLSFFLILCRDGWKLKYSLKIILNQAWKERREKQFSKFIQIMPLCFNDLISIVFLLPTWSMRKSSTINSFPQFMSQFVDSINWARNGIFELWKFDGLLILNFFISQVI